MLDPSWNTLQLENELFLCVRQLSNFRYRMKRFVEIALERGIDEKFAA
jgi:hypothetical protein